MAKKPTKLRRGDPQPSAQWFADLDTYLDSVVVDVSDGGELDIEYSGAGAPILHLARYNCHKVARAPAGGISARSGAVPGSADCTIQAFDGVRFQTAAVIPVRNWSGSAVAGNAYIYIGIADGYWWVVAEECTATAAMSSDFNADFSADFGVDATNQTTGTSFNADFNADFGEAIAGVNEIQRLSISGPATSGTFTINHATFSSTYGVAWNTSAATLLAALQARTAVGSIAVTGGPWPGTPLDIEWIGPLGATNQPLLLDVLNTIYGGVPSITVIQNGT